MGVTGAPKRVSMGERRPRVAIVVVAMLLSVGGALGAEVDYASLLSRETVAFVQVRRVSKLIERVAKLGPLDKLLRDIGLPAKHSAEVERVLRGLRSLNWSFHVPGMGGRSRSVDVLLIADHAEPRFVQELLRDGAKLKELRFAPGSAPPEFDADTLRRNHGYVWAEPELGKIVVATDPALVYGVAEAFRKGRAASLASDPAYKLVGLPHVGRDIQGYGSVPELVRTVASGGGYVSRREAAKAAFLMGLVGSSAVSYAQNFDGSRAEALAGPVPEGVDSSILRCIGGAVSGAALIPEDAIVSASVGVRDGTRLWALLRRILIRFAVSHDQKDGEREFERDLARTESELGFRIDEAAEVVKGVGVFVAKGWGCGFVYVRDAGKARDLLRRALPRGRRRFDVAGEEAFWVGRKSDGFAYLQRGDCVLISPKVEWLRRAASSIREGITLAKSDAFPAVKAKLGDDSLLFALLRPGKIPKNAFDDDLLPVLGGLGKATTLVLSLDGRLLKARLTGAPDPVRMLSSVIELQRKRRRPVPRATRMAPAGRMVRGSTAMPDRVLNRRSPYILAEPPWTVRKIRYRDWIRYPVDPATSYRIRSGKKWSGMVTCATCKRPIPVPPRSTRMPTADAPEDDMPKPYKCPRCGKEANKAVLEELKIRRR